MLAELRIEDLGIIAEQKLLFGRGLTVVTGETGAGKTMLIEAINLLVGGRADATIVRPGAHEARIEGRFVGAGDGVDDEVVLCRVVPADGRSRAYVDGRLATVAQLAEHGARAVDLHGQHAHQSLLSAGVQRSALDHFGGVDLAPLRAARQRVSEIDAALAALGGDARARAREIDLLRFQLDELHAAAISGPDEDDELSDAEDVLAGAVAHREAAAQAIGALSGDDAPLSGASAADLVGQALAAIAHRAPFAAHADRLRSLAAELADVAAELRSTAEGIEDDPERLAEVRARRQLLRDLRRKYGDTLAEVLAFTAQAEERLAELESYEARAAALDAERAGAQAAVAAAARAVLAARRAGAPKLAAAVEAHLRRLAMPHARVAVSVDDGDGDGAPADDTADDTADGAAGPGDHVVFLLAANPGSPLLPLGRVASGGELARAMLALRLVLSEAPDTLLFDEVDAGIGGEAAIAVGRALAELATRHQVFVVTHLAQVAAMADQHLVVRKRVRRGTTTTEVSVVEGDDRVAEVARMLSGHATSAAAREHALELLGGTARRG